jgi:chemotaxis protein CheX
MPQDSSAIQGLTVNELVTNSIISSVENGIKMCNLTTRVVGITKIPIQIPNATVTGMIGMNGKCTGFMSISMPQNVAIKAVSGLLMEKYTVINPQVIDGVGEMTNIIAGGLKTKLYNTLWMVNTITIPSVILGDNYHIAYSKGIEYCGITFEIDDPDTLTIHDRVFMVNTSLIQATS